MSYLLLVSKDAPFNSIKARESIELGLSASNVELQVKMLFMNQGIYQLSNCLEESFTEQKSIAKQISLLDMYEIEDLYAYSSSGSFDNFESNCDFSWLNQLQAQELMQSARQIVVL